MRLRALFACILIGIAAGNPLRLRDAYGNSGYDYGVQHPAGRSRVHVRTGGGDRNGNHYPVQHNAQYFPDKSYVNSNSDSNRHHPYRQHPNYESSSNVPAYVEHSYPSPPASYQQSSNYYPIYDQSLKSNYPQRHVIPQEHLGRESLYGKFIDETPSPVKHSDYSRPHIQQIADDTSPNYEPIKQLTLEEEPPFAPASENIPADKVIPFSPEPQVIQQVSDDLPLNFELSVNKYPDSSIDSQLPVNIDPPPVIPGYIKPLVDEQVHIDQKSEDFPAKSVLSQENSPIISQKVLDSTFVPSKDQEDIPDTKLVPLLAEPPISQQEFIDVSPPNPVSISAVKYDTDSKISQEALDTKASFDLNDNSQLKQSNVPDTVQSTEDLSENYKTVPVSLKISQNPIPISQTTVDHHPSQAVYDSPVDPLFSDDHSPKNSLHDQPTYRFEPIGEPYEKFSHSTEIIHPPSPNSPHGAYPLGPKEISVQTPLTDVSPVSQTVLTEIPASNSVKLPSHSQKHLLIDAPLVKHPSISQSTNLLPNTQQVLEEDLPLTQKSPSYLSLKHPPSPQEHLHVVGPYTKNSPSPPSVKFPPQKHLNVDGPIIKNPPPYTSVKLPPPTQEHLQVDGPFTKTSPSHSSVKLPLQPQEHLDVNGPFTKNHPSLTSVKLPPPLQEHLHVDGPITKNLSPYPSVKLPPPTQDHLLVDGPFTKTSPSHPSVKLPPPPQEHLDVNGPFPKNPPLHSSVKLPPPPQEHLHIDGPFTKTVPSYSVKLPSPTPEHLHINGPFPKTAPSYSSVKLPPPSQKHLHVDGPFVKHPPSYPSVKLPSPPQEHLHIDGPIIKNPSYSPSVKLPPPPQEHLNFDGSFIKNPPSYSSVKVPPPSQEHLHIDRPIVKNPPPYPSIKHPLPPQKQLHIDGPFTKNVPSYPSIKLPPPPQEHLHVDGSFTKNPPFNPSIKLPPPPQTYLHSDGPASHIKGGPSHTTKTGLPGVKSSSVESHSDSLYPIGVQAPPTSVSAKHPSAFVSPQSTTLHENSHLKNPQQLEDSLSEHPPVSHSIQLPSIEPKSLSPNQIDDNGTVDDKSQLNKHTPISHSVRLSIPDPASKVTSVPNLFAAVPSPSDEEILSNKDTSSNTPVAEALVSGPIHPSEDLQELNHHRPISHSVRLPIPSSRASRNPNDVPKTDATHFADDHRKEDYPAFPVESAFNQKDPVSDKVSDLTQGYRNGAGHHNSNHEPEDDDSSNTPPSVNDARLEVDRISKEIGASFGDRLLPNSRF